MHPMSFCSNFMLLQYGYGCKLNRYTFCNNYYILTIDVNAVATLLDISTTFCLVTQLVWKQIMFVVTGKM